MAQVMRIWLEGNLGAHDFIPEAYWRAQYAQVQEQLAQAEVFVYEENGNIRGFAGMTGSYLAGIFVDQTALPGDRKGNPGISERTLSGIYAACVPEKSACGGFLSAGRTSDCGKGHG